MSSLTLTEMIRRREWEAVVSTIKKNPSEASVEELHLHEACKYDPPKSVIEAFVQANGRFHTAADDNGQLPMHTACFYGASAEVIEFLADWDINSLSVRSRVSNQTPLEIAQTTAWQKNAENQGSVIKFLQKTTFPGFFDDLTDLPRKKAFEKWAHLSPHGDCYAFVFFIDIVGFKYLNDRGGQDVGDDAIRTYASSIEKECRMFEADSMHAEDAVGLSVDVFRVGGDEFVVLVKSVADEEDSSPKAVWKLICDTFLPNLASLKESTYHTFVRVGCSAGTVSTSEDVEAIRKRADRLQNEAKSQLKTLRGKKPLRSEYQAEGMSKVKVCNRLMEWHPVPSCHQVRERSTRSTSSEAEDTYPQQVLHTEVPPPRSHLCSWCLRNPRRRKMRLYFILAGTAMIVAVGISLGLLRWKNAGSVEASNAARMETVKRIIVDEAISSSDTLDDVNSPQHKAAFWLANLDTSQVSLHDTSRILQRYILAVLFYSTDGDNWIRRHSFLSGAHECKWHISRRFGVISCDSDNRPKELKLDSSELAGVIPSELGKLTSLAEVSLRSNRLSGEIPSSMGLLENLTILDMGDNNLVGTVPSSFVNLSSLINITLEGNGFVGNLTAFCDAWDGIEYFSADLSQVTCPCCHCCNASGTVAEFRSQTSARTTPSTTKSPTMRPSKPSKQPSLGGTSVRGYPNCRVERPDWIGNGVCSGGQYNTAECGWDGRDCVVEGYPGCHVDSPHRIGDGRCQPKYNTEECGWDGGDCVVEGYPDCHVDHPTFIGSRVCMGGPYNTEECGWDGGDCIEFNKRYPDCHVNYPGWIGDGQCSGEEYNTEECGYDGGDCCEESCKPGPKKCKGPWDKCIDPKYRVDANISSNP